MIANSKTHFMPNKPRSPEISGSNLFRTAVLLILAPACATTLPTGMVDRYPKLEKRCEEMWKLTDNGKRHFKVKENQHFICGENKDLIGKWDETSRLRKMAYYELRFKLLSLINLDHQRQKGIEPQPGDSFFYTSNYYVHEFAYDETKGRICVHAQTNYMESNEETFEKTRSEICKDPYFLENGPNCEKERRGKAANISAERRSKFSKGSKSSNRR